MIENIRNYYWLMIVVLVALFVSFLFTDLGGIKNTGGSSDGYVRIDGTVYSVSDFEKQGETAVRLSMQLGMLSDFTAPLEGFGDPDAFFVRRMLVRQAGEQFGIQPDQEEIANYVKSLAPFANRSTGQYDPVAYRNLIEKHIGRFGMTEADVLSMASDALILKKLSEILGAGFRPNREVTVQGTALSRQKITAEVAKIGIAPFKEAIKPTDDEVKAYWENIQEAFKTEPKRKFTYILASPKVPEVAPASTPDGEQKEGEPAKPDPTKEDPKILEERKNQERALNQQVTDFLQQLETSRGSRFEEIAKELGFESKTTELFPPSAPPTDLALSLRSAPGGRTNRLSDVLFNLTTTSDPLSKISEAYPVGENQWLVVRLDQEEPSRVKTFEEAKDEATAQFIEEKAQEAMKKDAEDKLAQIRTALSGGKSFADAAKEVGLESKRLDQVTRTYRPTEGVAPMNLFDSASTVDPGTVADVIVEPEMAFIVFVEKREVEKMADAGVMLDSEIESSANNNQRLAFSTWLKECQQSANIEHLIKRR